MRIIKFCLDIIRILWPYFALLLRDSVSFFRLFFLLVISCAISPVCCLKYPYRCFSSNFFRYFLQVRYVGSSSIAWMFIIIIIIIIYSLDFFISVLADGLLLETEWQQVSSSLQDSSQYSGRLQYCCSLDGLHLAANFQINCYLHVP